MTALAGRLHILIAGVSTRAAAESAAEAGFAVTALDAFGDIDQHPSVRVVALAPPFTARAAARASESIDCDAVVYLASFENHPKSIEALAAGRGLWGNTAETVRRVRDPLLLAEVVRRRGFAAPMVRLNPDTPSDRPPDSYVVSGSHRPTQPAKAWLVKPIASGGGFRVARADPAETAPRGFYFQQLIEGRAGSVAFVAAGGRAVALGVSSQLVGDEAFGAAGYQYCGSILGALGDPQFACDDQLVETAGALAQAIAEEFGLVGLNGIDFVARDGVPYPIEVNPRWSASMELVERAYGLSILGIHASACARGTLPEFDLVNARRGHGAVGKAIVFARHDLAIGNTTGWRAANHDVRDVPRPGDRVPAGRPICTVFATGSDAAACHRALAERARAIYSLTDAWYA